MNAAVVPARRALLLGLTATGLGSGTTAAMGQPASPDTAPHTAVGNAAALQEVLAYAREQRTTGLLIIEDRGTVVEHNWPLPDDADAGNFKAAFVHGTAREGALREDVASQQKSFIAILAGVAVDQALLDVDRPVAALIGPGWSRSPGSEARITVRHLLEMNSGLSEGLTHEAEPGARFFYNTPAFAVIKHVLEQVSGRSLDELTRRWLTLPLAMDQTEWRQRPPALTVPGNPTGLVSTPGDIARMGQLVLDRGLGPGGRRVISDTQLDRLLQGSPTNPSYGRLWWLNGGSYAYLAGAGAPRIEGPLVPSAPADTVLALGAMDRALYVVPSRRLIVVRMGRAAPARDFREQFWRRLNKALPNRR